MPADETDAKSEALAALLRAQIKREGPISFRDWMAAALYHPEFGYYQRADLQRWGRAGDYRTAPESSAHFGATFARYFAECWRRLGQPSRWTICEVGAGGGDFAHACLAYMHDHLPELERATEYSINEISRISRDRIRTKLGEFGNPVRFSRWPEQGPEIPVGIVFANELLDAFPVTRVTKSDGRLAELGVGNDEYGVLDEHGRFCWTLRTEVAPETLEFLRRNDIELVNGQTVDLNLAAPRWWQLAGSKLERGFLIAVDYGAEAGELYSAELRPGGSLRAIAGHQLLPDPLAMPGRADLTAHVDWTSIRCAGEAAGFATIVFRSLDKFLLESGAHEVLTKAGAGSDPVGELALRTSLHELILPGGLAGHFQILIQSKIDGTPPI